MQTNEHTKTYILNVLVENNPGVLYRISNLFTRRGFNMDSVSVGQSEKDGLARMTITFKGDERLAEQVIKQINKLVEVIKANLLYSSSSVARELALINVKTTNEKIRSDVINYTKIFKGHIVDVSHESLIIEITGNPEKINAFIDLMSLFSVNEIARTGITALKRGKKSINID